MLHHHRNWDLGVVWAVGRRHCQSSRLNLWRDLRSQALSMLLQLLSRSSGVNVAMSRVLVSGLGGQHTTTCARGVLGPALASESSCRSGVCVWVCSDVGRGLEERTCFLGPCLPSGWGWRRSTSTRTSTTTTTTVTTTTTTTTKGCTERSGCGVRSTAALGGGMQLRACDVGWVSRHSWLACRLTGHRVDCGHSSQLHALVCRGARSVCG